MTEPHDRRTLDQIITDNAMLLLRRRVASRAMERKSYYLHTLAEEMAPHMKPDPHGDAPNTVNEIDRISKSVSRYLGLARTAKVSWRVDYVEGFCQAMGVSLDELTSRAPLVSPAEAARQAPLIESVTWLIPPGKRRERKSPPESA